MLKKQIKGVKIAGYAQLQDVEVEVLSIVLAGTVMTVQYKVRPESVDGVVLPPIKEGNVAIDTPAQLAAGISQVFDLYLPGMLAKIGQAPESESTPQVAE
jgi:hypothetical protein